VSEEGGTGPLTPVIVAFVAQADATTSTVAEQRLSVNRRSNMELLCGEFNYDFGQTSYR
jgi:hypothetical protein